MPTAAERKEADEQKLEERNRFATKITNDVLANLGTPANLHDVQVRHIDNRKYRVNIRVHDWNETDTCAMKSIVIKHSFFVTVNDDGQVVRSNPAIAPIYKRGAT